MHILRGHQEDYITVYVGTHNAGFNQELYYDKFFTELEFNRKIKESPYAANFPTLFASGFWNDLPDRRMLIYENLGKKLPVKKCEIDEVYETIKERLQELHSLGIIHCKVGLPNIHVSQTGKASLVGLGNSCFSNDAELQNLDFENLAYCLDA
ncbi:uncharacterized protein RJT20DRAFT_3784 [Scheffersomyces xylosifermentans]|uniref:uncharacterized protein n=1 Tax=Scheffersomyces xylosifermentans TaxID=1304137 RepID=UPI00315D1C00